MKKIKLNKQASIPVLGFGTWQLEGNVAQKAVQKALGIGYRHIDAAKAYSNHRQVGEAIKKSGLPRKELFITSKLWITDYRKKDVASAFHQTLKELQLQYLDLYLIHWPNRSIPFADTLGEMDKLKKKGLIKALGVSNFTINHLKDAIKTGMQITNNQVEFHPSLNQEELKDFCDSKGIVLTAYSPIAQGEDLKLPEIKELAKKYNRSPAQVVLNWLISKNIVAIPRSANPKHIEDNYKAIKWQLEPEDVKLINNLNTNNRIVQPSFADFDY